MLKRFNFNRFILAHILMGTSFVAGIAGFMLIEGYTLGEAFYMTVITISTVGYAEVRPLTEVGRIFASFYILFNLVVVAYLLSVLTKFIFDGELHKLFDMFKTDQEIKHFSGHVIVCGFGRNGRKAWEELLANGVRVVVVEQDEQLLKRQREEAGEKPVTAVVGDATLDSVLEQAGIARASALITSLPKDADNVFVALSARALNPALNIIARASYKSSESKLRSAGANSVVMPDEIGGSHMANLVVRPEVIRFLDLITGLGADKLQLEEQECQYLQQEFQGKSIRELDVRGHSGASIIGLRQRDGQLVVSPPADYCPVPGDVLILLGNEAHIKKFQTVFRQ